MAETTFIYGLIDTNGKIFYIGKSDDPEARLKVHIRNTVKNKFSVKYENFKKHMPFSVTIIEECPVDTWEDREIFHISQHQDLYNISGGGADHRTDTRGKETRTNLHLLVRKKGLTKRFGEYKYNKSA